MAELDLTDPEPDARFPSGPWQGFYLQYWLPGRHPTRMHFSWQNGRLEGRGRDEVGTYSIAGSYDVTTGRCEWIKQYIGKHAVSYRGLNDGHGIWGAWELPQLFGLFVDRGGFHVWPEGTDVSEESDRTEQAVRVAMRKELRGRFSVLLILFVVFLLAGTAVALHLLRRRLVG